MRILRTLLAGSLILSVVAAHAAHTQVQLVLAADPARPGDTVLAGVHLKMDPGWHTYWKNSGEAGKPTTIDWQLPPGVTAGDVQWPVPKKLPPEEVTTYGYDDEVVLLIPLKLAADLKPGPLELKAKVKWLECKEQCVPGEGTVNATLNVGSETKPSADAALLNEWKTKIPGPGKTFLFSARWEKALESDTRTLIIEGARGAPTLDFGPIENVDFFPDASDNFEVQGPTEKVNSKADFALRKSIKKFSGDWPSSISGVIVVEGGGGHRDGFEMSVPIAQMSQNKTYVPFSLKGLLSALGLAFVGGLILNIMPCVLPVIALKIFSFVKQSGEQPGRARLLGLVYALGILVSFVVLAVFLIGLQNAGQVASWGSQMQDKSFVLGMTILVTLVALNLFGVFEVMLGGKAADAASRLSSRSGAPGVFFNGILATALAIPCTAPFLATALAFAFTQPPRIIVLIFCFIAFGLAAPYVVLTWNPRLLKFLPKPGAWMERFKVALGFPMLATAVWLYKLSLNHLEKGQALWFGIFLVTLGLAAWIWGEFVQRGSRRRVLAATISLALLAGVGTYAATRHEGIKWQKWSEAAVEQARQDGHPVLVDFTADWCVTCQWNLSHSIDVPEVREKLAGTGAVTLVADYTLKDDTIGRELHRFGRDAVPLVVVFPSKPTAEPIVLPPVLQQSTVLAALNQASKND